MRSLLRNHLDFELCCLSVGIQGIYHIVNYVVRRYPEPPKYNSEFIHGNGDFLYITLYHFLSDKLGQNARTCDEKFTHTK